MSLSETFSGSHRKTAAELAAELPEDPSYTLTISPFLNTEVFV